MIIGYEKLLDTVLEKINKEICLKTLICDHICYRVETELRYQKLKNELALTCELVTESEISGRLISIFKLPNPILYRGLRVDCLELPAPKKDSFYKEGWEHAEFVIEDLKQFIKDHPHIDFNHKAMDRDINPELGYRVSNEYQVKFHPLHILEVIKVESQL
ncbi:MAG: hypothetical protein HN576_03645 [Bacteriovoracaceae bacterium]|jgi:uncharacterized protein|nr:hypothetical protein [Bacteriovoracaceae bacterium]